jgi:hypothetical protein
VSRVVARDHADITEGEVSYRCYRNEFNETQFNQHRHSFWAMPTAWTQAGGQGMLASLWRAGGAGAIAILPILGQYAHSDGAGSWILSKEELARLSGLDPKTVAYGATVLAAHGLVSQDSAIRFGKRTTLWDLRAVAAPRSESGFGSEYFYFSSRLIYGGNWARLTPTQQAVYLAVGSQARTFVEAPVNNPLLQIHLAYGTSLLDFQRCYEQDSARRWLRLACLSGETISVVSGVSLSAVKNAIKGFKHPAIWPNTTNDRDWLQRSPLGVYRGNGGALIYHLRDHASHWPWVELNQSSSAAARASTSSPVGGRHRFVDEYGTEFWM